MKNRSLDSIESGDLIVWGSAGKDNNILSYIVRLFTLSDYSHIGIAIKKSDGIYVADANLPKVKISKLELTDRMYLLKTSIPHDSRGDDFIKSTLGLPYSIMDGIRAVLGIVSKKDDRWQCAEYVLEYLKIYGVDLGAANTPARLVRKAMEVLNSPLIKLKR